MVVQLGVHIRSAVRLEVKPSHVKNFPERHPVHQDTARRKHLPGRISESAAGFA